MEDGSPQALAALARFRGPAEEGAAAHVRQGGGASRPAQNLERGQNRGPKKIEWSLYSVKTCLIDAVWTLKMSYRHYVVSKSVFLTLYTQ